MAFHKTSQSTATQKLKNKAKASLTLLLVAVISITTATYAWFSLSNTTMVQNMTVQVGTGVNLKASTTFSTNLDAYKTVISNADIDALIKTASGDNKKALSTIRLWPLTSGNGTKLYTESTNTVAGAESIDAANQYYLELPLWFMADTDMNVYLNGQDSPGKTGAEADGTLVFTEETSAAKKAVEKAVRISFAPMALKSGAAVGTATNYTVAEAVHIYEPNKVANQVKLASGGNAYLDNGNRADQPTFDNLGDNAGTGTPKPAKPTDPPVVFTLTANTPKKVVVRLWIEGEDPECVNGETGINIELAKVLIRLRFCGADETGAFIEASTS